MRFVLCVGMLRSCSTWQYEVSSHLVELSGQGERLGFLDHERFPPVRDARHDDPLVGVVKAHDHHEIYAETIAKGDVRLIYSHRDVRDVVYSFMWKARLDFDGVMAAGFLKRVLDNDRAWRSYPAILAQSYDGILADPVDGVTAIARHLDIPLARSQAEAIAHEYSWELNHRRMMAVRQRAISAGIDLSDRENVFEHDPRTLLHWNHLRDDRGRSWREIATLEERRRLGELCAEWLIDAGYEEDDRWIKSPTLGRPIRMLSPESRSV